MSSIDYGQVSVELGEEVYVLKPTLAALQRLDQRYGSLREAAQRVADLNLGALCAVVAAGAGLTAQEEKALPERVFRAGIANVAVPVTDYLVTLMNPSGREIEEGEGEPGKP